jgi:hypothetical protein
MAERRSYSRRDLSAPMVCEGTWFRAG